MLASALLMLAWSATSIVTAFGARWLPDTLSARARLIMGLVGVASGQLALFAADLHRSVFWFLPGLLMAGIANGILNAAIGYQAVTSVLEGRAAMGSGANNTARYVGSSIGLAIVALLVTQGGESGGMDGVLTGWNSAVMLTTAFSLFGAVVVFVCKPGPNR